MAGTDERRLEDGAAMRDSGRYSLVGTRLSRIRAATTPVSFPASGCVPTGLPGAKVHVAVRRFEDNRNAAAVGCSLHFFFPRTAVLEGVDHHRHRYGVC